MVVVSDITRERGNEIFLLKDHKTDHAAVLRLEHIRIVLCSDKWVDHHLRCVILHELFSSIHVKDVGYVRAAEHARCEKEESDQSWKDAKDDKDLIVQLE